MSYLRPKGLFEKTKSIMDVTVAVSIVDLHAGNISDTIAPVGIMSFKMIVPSPVIKIPVLLFVPSPATETTFDHSTFEDPWLVG